MEHDKVPPSDDRASSPSMQPIKIDVHTSYLLKTQVALHILVNYTVTWY